MFSCSDTIMDCDRRINRRIALPNYAGITLWRDIESMGRRVWPLSSLSHLNLSVHEHHIKYHVRRTQLWIIEPSSHVEQEL